MTSSFKSIKLETDGSLAFLTINRPDVRNALNQETVDEMHLALRDVSCNESVHVLVITGAGDSSFVAGADIGELRDRGKREALQAINQNLFTAVENISQPVIGAINGYALGGGCELALACDIRIASDAARFGFPETGLGIMPAAGGTQRLPRIIGWGRARELILTGRILDAFEAETLGLVSKVVSTTELMGEARTMADKIACRGPLATRMAKLALNASARGGLDVGLQIEKLGQAILFESRDKMEGTTAFLEKRKPKFNGE